MIIDLILTPAGRERLAGGWARLPKPTRVALTVTAYVTAIVLVVGLIGWATVVTCAALGAAGHDGLAIFAGIVGVALAFGVVCGAAVYAAERD
jgi:hypothetical protein